MKNKIEKYLRIIENITPISVKSAKIVAQGGESVVFDINNKWIFRFYKSDFHYEKFNKRIKFLQKFSKISKIKVPVIEYKNKDFVGYKKILGKPLYPSSIEKLRIKDRLKVANQIGLFLKNLHSYKSKNINFDTGYLVMRKNDYKVCPKELADHLNKKEIDNLNKKLKEIADNKLNFVKEKNIIHGDFHYNNILWNPENKKITGIIDWSEVGFGIPAMDFIMIADFSKSKNDKFLKQMLSSYGVKDNKLFNQIKQDYIIDVMNWFWTYLAENDLKGIKKIIKKLKRILK